MGTYLAVRKGIKDKQIPPNLTQRKVKSRGGETPAAPAQAQCHSLPSEAPDMLTAPARSRLWKSDASPTHFSLAGRREGGDEFESRGEHPSMEGVEEQQDGADADDAAQDEGIPSLPEVDPLDQAVHGWKTVCQGIHLALY